MKGLCYIDTSQIQGSANELHLLSLSRAITCSLIKSQIPPPSEIIVKKIHIVKLTINAKIAF